MKVSPTKDGVTLKLSVDEAVALEAVLGGACGPLARVLPWYDSIADVLEEKHLPTTIAHAVEQRFYYFRTEATFWDAASESFKPNPRYGALEKA